MKRQPSHQAQRQNTLGDWYAEHGKHWGRNLLVSLFALLVFVSGGKLLLERLQPGNLPIRSIELRGDLKRVDVAAVKALVGPYVSGGVMRADVHNVAALVEGQPWVSRAWVRKRWPDTLEIQLITHKPVARWGEDAWIDEDAVVFAGSEQPDQERFDVLEAPEGLEKAVLSAYRDYNHKLAKVGVDLRRLSVDQRRAWRIETKDKVIIELGRRDIDRRLMRFVSIYRSELTVSKDSAGRRMELADMRYPHGLAVRWQQLEADDMAASGPVEKG